MNDSSNDVARWIQEITRRALTEQVHSWQRYTDFIQRVARGELDEQSVREEYMRFSREEGLRYARQLTGLSLSYYNQLVELSRAFNEQFFNQVFKTPSQTEPGDEKTARQVEMGLRASLGTEAKGSFVLENRRTESADISFLVDEFRDEHGKNPFRPPLQIQPPRFQLGPRQEIVVRLTLPLLPELFAAGQTYSTTIVVRGYDDLELLLRVKVDPLEENGRIRIKSVPEPASGEPSKTSPVAGGQDLTSLKGLGKGYARKLRESGIHSIAELAQADLSVHRQVLGANGLRQAERFQWIEQARLMEAGDTERLRSLQAGLKPEGEQEGGSHAG